MGASIAMKVGGEWQSITPGWRSQMATWLQDIGGDRDTLVFTDTDIPLLEERREKQRKGEAAPPFDQSKEWTECFDKIISQIRAEGEALVRVSY